MSKHMRQLVRTMVVAVVLLMALPASAALPPRPPSGNGIDLIGHSTPADLSGYVMSIMQPWDFAKQAQATSQGSIPAEYKDLTSTRATDCGTNAVAERSASRTVLICPPGVNDAPNYAGGLGFAGRTGITRAGSCTTTVSSSSRSGGRRPTRWTGDGPPTNGHGPTTSSPTRRRTAGGGFGPTTR